MKRGEILPVWAPRFVRMNVCRWDVWRKGFIFRTGSPEREQVTYNLCITVEDDMSPVEIKSAGIVIERSTHPNLSRNGPMMEIGYWVQYPNINKGFLFEETSCWWSKFEKLIITLFLVDGYMMIDASKYRCTVGVEIASTRFGLKASSCPCGLVHAIMNTPSAKNNIDHIWRRKVQFEWTRDFVLIKLIGFQQIPMRDCAICMIRMVIINGKETYADEW